MPQHLKPVKLQIAALAINSKTQQRHGTSNDAVKEYVDAIKNGVTLPPIDVFFDGVMYFIGDGWHRVQAYKEAGHSCIFAVVHDGTLRDAIYHACGANKEHGLRRTNADKKQAVMTLLNDNEWVELSDRMIASHCGVNHETVAKYRANVDPQLAISPVGSSATRRTGRDGKKRPTSQKKKGNSTKDVATQEVSEPDEPEVVDDADDFNPETLPDSMIDLAALQADYKSCVNALTKVKTTMVALAGDEKYGVFLCDKITRITTEIDSMRATIKQMTPFEVCAGCKGEGCKKCSNSGFFTKFAVSQRAR